ncbi:RNA binding protein [Tirmania nivea]|nr:RNA binding protein [Tirmania nivea]
MEIEIEEKGLGLGAHGCMIGMMKIVNDMGPSSRGRERNGNGHAGGRRDGRDGIPPGAARLRVENLHYELGQEDLTSLFNRIAPTVSVQLKYDRAGRSEGIAYVTYERERDARRAIDEFDGANAHGQPIRLSIISTSSTVSSASNPNAGRSLFDRVERPRSLSPIDLNRDRDRERVRPSGRGSKIDRYVPVDRDRVRERERRDRPIVDKGEGRYRRRDGGGNRRRGDRGRRGGGGGGGGAGSGEGKTGGNRRPRKTIEELDEEMSNYWNETAGEAGGEQQEQNGGEVDTGAAPVMDDDMMIE